MVPLQKKSLMYFEDLAVPKVIVLKASVGCDTCQRRVSQLISNMTGLREYTVDIRNKQVVVKGDFRTLSKKKRMDAYCSYKESNNDTHNPWTLFFRSFIVTCLGQDLAH